MSYPVKWLARTTVFWRSGTGVQCLPRVTRASASIAPNPNLWLTMIPAPLVDQPPSINWERSEVWTIRYCTSLQLKLGLQKWYKHVKTNIKPQSIMEIWSIMSNVQIQVAQWPYLACNSSAMAPETIGAEALVPVKSSLHSPLRVVVV